MKLKLIAAAAAFAISFAPAHAAPGDETVCQAPTAVKESGNKIALLYSFFGRSGGAAQVIQYDALERVGADRATLTVKCEVELDNGRVVNRSYRNPVRAGAGNPKFFYNAPQAPNRQCDRVTSIFLRVDAQPENLEALTDGRPIRVCHRGQFIPPIG